VGLVARVLEEQGFSTLVLTVMPEFQRLVGMPRVAAVEYPFGRPVGNVHDRSGQRAVLMEALSFLERATRPGEVFHLPFTWPEEPRKANWQPLEPSPIIRLFLGDIRKARKEEAGR
jgi:hypothetical protein